MTNREAHEKNRQSWNAATVAHNSHKHDQAAYFRAGGDTLFPEEAACLGDLRGRSVVHLQCNSGQDTLSLARRGATVTGVDISDAAIAFATQLAADSSIPAAFERADIYDWLEDAVRRSHRFDIAFASYGALCWLSDLATWARDVATILNPGGRLVVVEFHPFLAMFDEKLERKFDYFSGVPIVWSDGVRDYVAASGEGLTRGDYLPGVENFQNPHACVEFPWSIGDILSSVLAADLKITHFREYPYANGCKFFDIHERDAQDRWRLPAGFPTMPHMYSLAAAMPS